MNKLQAQIYVNNIGQYYSRFTCKTWVWMIVSVAAFVFMSLAFYRSTAFTTVVCVVAAVFLIAAFALIKRYMSILRLTVMFTVNIGAMLFAFNCWIYSLLRGVELFVWWAIPVVIAVQLLVGGAVFALVFTRANKITSKKAMVVGSVAALVPIIGATIGGRNLVKLYNPSAEETLAILLSVSGILVLLLSVVFAALAVRLYTMLRYGVRYEPPRDVAYIDFTEQLNGEERMTSVLGLRYDKYDIYIYFRGKNRKCKLLVFDGKTLVSKQKFKSPDALAVHAEIDGKQLGGIWCDVELM